MQRTAGHLPLAPSVRCHLPACDGLGLVCLFDDKDPVTASRLPQSLASSAPDFISSLIRVLGLSFLPHFFFLPLLTRLLVASSTLLTATDSPTLPTLFPIYTWRSRLTTVTSPASSKPQRLRTRQFSLLDQPHCCTAPHSFHLIVRHWNFSPSSRLEIEDHFQIKNIQDAPVSVILT